MLCKSCKKRPINIERSICKCTECLDSSSKSKRAYYRRNKEKIKAYQKEYEKINKNAISIRQKNYSKKRTSQLLASGICTCCGKNEINFDRSKNYCTICADKNKERVKRLWSDDLESSREKHRHVSRKYYKSNLDKVKVSKRRYYDTHRDVYDRYRIERRNRELGVGGMFTEDEWNAVLRMYDGKCLNCGTSDRIEKDHVIPLTKGGTGNIDNIQPLCRSCNARKHTRIIDFRPFGSAILDWT